MQATFGAPITERRPTRQCMDCPLRAAHPKGVLKTLMYGGGLCRPTPDSVTKATFARLTIAPGTMSAGGAGWRRGCGKETLLKGRRSLGILAKRTQGRPNRARSTPTAPYVGRIRPRPHYTT